MPLSTVVCSKVIQKESVKSCRVRVKSELISSTHTHGFAYLSATTITAVTAQRSGHSLRDFPLENAAAIEREAINTL